MSYKFKSSDKTVTDAVRRIAASEFALIAAALANAEYSPAQKVHEGRKGTKRLRALLRLIAPVCGEARSEIAALRSAAGRLSALRDKEALTETLARVALPGETASQLQTGLSAGSSASARHLKRMLAEFSNEMTEAALRAQSWTLEADGWEALSPGLERSYRRVRRALAAVKGAETEEPMHDLRKRAKDHWYHTLLMRGVFPDVMDGYADAAERLCDELGDWRDLGLLAQGARSLPAHVFAKSEADAALKVIEKAQRRSLRRARKLSRRLTAESTDAYMARLKAWWAISH